MAEPPEISTEDRAESDTTVRRARGERRPTACSIRVIVGDEVKAYTAPVSGEVALGRGGDIVIAHTNISRRHVAVRFTPSVEVCDLNSTNGTTLFGSLLEASTWVPIRPGDVIVVGGEALIMLHDGDVRSVPTRQMGEDALERSLSQRIIEQQRTHAPFTVCTVTSRSAKRWVEVVAGVLLEGDELVVLSDTEVAAILSHRTTEQAEYAMKTMEEHLVRVGASPRIHVRHCPKDGTSASDLMVRPRTDARAQRTTMRPSGPLVRNAAMLEIYKLVDEVAPAHVNVLVLGETGTGKDVLAHAIHERSPRKNAPFVSLNCSALPESLLESELFGYERGAFTGAVTSKPGLLETAQGGTIFLDEVGEMPLATQAKFLRVLEERTVRRVGGLNPRPIDIRIIAATNRDPPKDIAQGRFRADLFYRLNGMSFNIPPLRERKDEISMFASHFMLKAAAILNKPSPKLSEAALACLIAHSWPGNIRELRNVIERAVLLARDRVVDPELFPPEVTAASGSSPPIAKPSVRDQWDAPAAAVPDDEFLAENTGRFPSLPESSGRLLDEVEQLEKTRVMEALAKCNGNQTRAAQLLGVTRKVLIKRIERYNLPRPRGPQQTD